MVLDSYPQGFVIERRQSQLVSLIEGMGVSHKPTLHALGKVPRHMFIPTALQNRAYENVSLPIGYSQTISQPYIVAKMTQLLLENYVNCSELDILELGTGSGYQASILASCVKQVYTIERIEGLLQKARNLLYDLKLKNISYLHSDGHLGWPKPISGEEPIFDGIIATAAVEEIPSILFQQLRIGGRLVMPQVNADGSQSLIVIERTETSFMRKSIETVNFVPFLKGVER